MGIFERNRDLRRAARRLGARTRIVEVPVEVLVVDTAAQAQADRFRAVLAEIADATNQIAKPNGTTVRLARLAQNGLANA